MKLNKLFIILLAFAVVSCQNFSVYALEGADILDANASYFCSEEAKHAVKVDGFLSSGEYSDWNRIVLNKDLEHFEVLHSSDSAKELDLNVALSYDSDFFYIGIEVGDGIALSPIKLDDGTKLYSMCVRIGLNSAFPEYLSYLENQYLFSPDDLSCVGVVGKRAVYSCTDRTFVGTVSSLNTETEKPYTDTEKGIVWNGETYSSEAALSSAFQGEKCFFECRIPMGDLMQIASDSILDGEGFIKTDLCGGFSFSTKIATDQYIVGKEFACGVRASDECLLSADDVTWKEYLSACTGIKKAMIPDVLLLPMFFSADPLHEENTPSNNNPPSRSESVYVEDPPLKNNDIITDIPLVSTSVTSPESDLFPGLPQIGDAISSHHDVIYHEGSKEDEESNKVLTSTLILIAGVFLFAAVIGTAFLFRYLEQKEKNDKARKKTNKKS